jgi:hypothetical protein
MTIESIHPYSQLFQQKWHSVVVVVVVVVVGKMNDDDDDGARRMNESETKTFQTRGMEEPIDAYAYSAVRS